MGLLHEGQTIRGTYEVERALGEGAFAEVYRVKHRFLGRQAMKVFKAVGMTIEEMEKMLGEAMLLSRIGHPNIVRVFEANVTETSKGTCGFFTMEYVAGGSLEYFWRSHGGKFVPVETTVEIMRQVCRGLVVAHSEKPPIIHRDIKPQNILIGYDVGGLRVRLTDFGLAKQVNPLTLLASAKGTPAFKAPEVFRNFRVDSCSGDVWAVGTTMYLLLTDCLPYAAGGDEDLLSDKRFRRPLVPPSRTNLQADPALEHIVTQALALRPEERYPTAREMLADLEKWTPRARDRASQKRSGDSSDSSKAALGAHSSPDEKSARQMVERATRLVRQPGKLVEAADLLEEALNKWPGLREQYEYRLQLWRRGIVM